MEISRHKAMSIAESFVNKSYGERQKMSFGSSNPSH